MRVSVLADNQMETEQNSSLMQGTFFSWELLYVRHNFGQMDGIYAT